uniref:Pre-mRNA-splicing factor Syf1-like N-terminal HAT-repeats domain-containing protein n=1 Tax=Oryza punctata TaxID=4537 RepID=A0A0E0M6K2_ORYPU
MAMLANPRRVKNKAPAPVQLTAEHLIQSKKRRIVDADELAEHQLERRARFEAIVRRASRGGDASAAWIRYARWEESPGGGSGDPARARSVYERALAGGAPAYRDHGVWIKYAQFEARSGRVGHARNVLDRAVAILRRVDRIWLEYLRMEELLGATDNARVVFDRWMEWCPDSAAWQAYAAFELRHGEVDRARAVYERHVAARPRADAFIRFTEFETKQKNLDRARSVYENAESLLAAAGDSDDTALLLAAFADFEERCGEPDRARAIYQHALRGEPPEPRAEEMREKLLSLEKRFGDRHAIEDSIVTKRRSQYEHAVTTNPLCYDAWFDLIRLEQNANAGDANQIRDLYKRAVSNVPPPAAAEKRHWWWYIYLWINYALFEELDAEDVPRARDVYRECLKTIPHKKFSFSKIWVMAAELEIRDKNLATARRLLGNAIGVAPRPKLFRRYIEIELLLGNVDRCRILSQKFIEHAPSNSHAWRSYAALEKKLGETDRARFIYDLAVAQPALDAPELVWTEYIQFEIDAGELDRARQLYERLLGKTQHLNVWVSYAEFEAMACSGGAAIAGNAAEKAERVRRCRAVFRRADEHFRGCADDLAMKEARAKLLQEWLAKEAAFGDLGEVELVEKKTPRRVKRKRSLLADGNGGEGSEEFFDYIFGDEDDATAAAGFKLLKAAYEWKNSGHVITY